MAAEPEEPTGQFSHTPLYALAILKYLKLSIRLNQQEYLREHWGAVYNGNNQDPIETIVDFYGSIFPMMETGERKVETTEFHSRRNVILRKMGEAELKEKFEKGDLDKILKQTITPEF